MLSWKLRPRPSLLSPFKTILVWMTVSGFLTYALLRLYYSSCYYPKVPVWVRTQPFALLQLWNGCKGNRCNGCNGAKVVFRSLAKPMCPLQKSLLNLVQSQSMSRSRENEAKGHEKKTKGNKQTEDGRWPSGCLGLLNMGDPPVASFSLFSPIQSWARPYSRSQYFQSTVKEGNSDPNIFGFFLQS